MTTVKRGASKVVPKLRFPEFRSAKSWTTTELRQLSEFVTERVGTTDCTPYTVSSGVGLVSQQEKLGRTIAGNSLKNYVVLEKDDFAYNKSATKAFPQGFIARYIGEDRAAVPNSIFTCFRTNKDVIDSTFLDNLFSTNLHGNWLRNRIAVGARAHGSLNISDEDLMDLPVPLPAGPSSLTEQQKIADCLTSLDEVIATQGRKVEALKAHKRGLMQQLFPREGETRPRLRFPEFRNAPEWKVKKLSALIDLVSGAHLSPGQYGSAGDVPYFTGPSDFTNDMQCVKKWTASSTNTAQEHDTLITVKGSGVGECWYLEMPSVAIGRQLMAVRGKASSSQFINQFLLTKRTRFEDLASGNLIPGLARGDILDLVAPFPKKDEQQRIADCLSSLDAQITAESNQLAALKTHKQGLMQQLFPAPKAASA